MDHVRHKIVQPKRGKRRIMQTELAENISHFCRDLQDRQRKAPYARCTGGLLNENSEIVHINGGIVGEVQRFSVDFASLLAQDALKLVYAVAYEPE